MKQSTESFAQNMIDNFEEHIHPNQGVDVSQMIEEQINQKVNEVIKNVKPDEHVSRETSTTNDDVELEESDESVTDDEILND